MANKIKTIGKYTDTTIFDSLDFNCKMAEGMSFEDYMAIEKTKGIRIAYRYGQSGKTKHLIYEYGVNGVKYYGANTVAYSPDIIAKMKGTNCIVWYDELNPASSKIDNEHTWIGVISMICGLFSLCFIIPFLPIILGGIGLTLSIMSLKKNKEYNIFAYAGLLTSSVGLISSIIISLVLVFMVIFSMVLKISY